MDKIDSKTRSRVMASVRANGSRSTEQKLQALFECASITGWRANVSEIMGKPDFVFDDARVVIFVDGCFWHGCSLHCRMPASNTDYWVKKIDRNRERDREVSEALVNMGWDVLRFWEHEIKETADSVIEKIRKALADTNET